jgi:hypothetical protein
VIRSRHFIAWVILCGTAFGASTPIADREATSGAVSLSAGAGEPASAIVSVAALAGGQLRLPEPVDVPSAISVGKAATPDPDPAETAVPAAESPVSETTSAASAPTPPPGTQIQLASISTSDPMNGYMKPTVRANETPDDCRVDQTCIDQYLWSLYERAPKVDVNKVTEQKKETITKDGKTLTRTKTITNFVLGDFTWKDPAAAQKANMPIKDYVIGGLDPGFKLTLYRALRKMDDAGFMRA